MSIYLVSFYKNKNSFVDNQQNRLITSIWNTHIKQNLSFRFQMLKNLNLHPIGHMFFI